ncbi:MAG: hypothetical protein QM667_11695 [Asticcacaulis sp.]
MGKLYDGAWVLVAGSPFAQQAFECLKGVFSVAGRFYFEDGRAFDRWSALPAIQMVMDIHTARENGLIEA